MVFDWPPTLRVRAPSFNKRGMTISGPQTLTGRSQASSIDAGYWVAALSGIPTVSAAAVKTFRALSALLEGGAHQIRVPVKDGAQAPWPLDGNGRPITSAGPVLFDDGASFDDGSAFWQPIIAVELAEAAALRATQIVVNVLNAGEIGGGEYFSIGDRLHVIKQVVSESGAEKTLAIWPPLREAVAEGAELNFDRPVCRMRLASEGAADLTLELGRFGFPDMIFVEVV